MEEPNERPARGARFERIAFGVGLVVLFTVAYWSMPESAPPPEFDATTLEPTPIDEPEAASLPEEITATSPETPLPPTGRLVIDPEQLEAGLPLTVHLGLPEPSRNEEPRPVRLISQPDNRILELEGRLSGDRTSAAIAIDPAYLTPGVYLVEVRTTERSHFPLRRYGIVVRD